LVFRIRNLRLGIIGLGFEFIFRVKLGFELKT
jgi:hypothetical protein